MTPRPLVFVAIVGAAGAAATLAIGAASGMPGGDLAYLAVLMSAAIAATVGATALARWALPRASFRPRLLAVTLGGVAVALLNLAVLGLLMFVDAQDAALTAVLLAYAASVGVAVALGLARDHAVAVGRLAATARRLATGDLDARAGRLGGGPELEALAQTLDDMAARLQASTVRERQAERMRRDLITAVSHDLRTPLAGLQAMVEAIDDGVVEDPPTLRRYAAEMQRAVGALSALVDDLFELSQLDAEAIRSETKRATLVEVVDSALAACESQAQAKSLRVETRLVDLDGTTCSPRLVRVIQNLLQNAIRHTPTDGGVLLEGRRTPEGVEVAVADTGEGIPPESLDRVFDPFWRGDDARSSPGSGLGLALARRIVEAMGGEITVESEPAQGSRFAVLLPSGRG